jgi:hypothetical protein
VIILTTTGGGNVTALELDNAGAGDLGVGNFGGEYVIAFGDLSVPGGMADTYNFSTGKFYAAVAGVDLGSTANRWNKLWSTDIDLSGGISLGTDLLPVTDHASNLGSATLGFNNVYSYNYTSLSDFRLKKNIADLSYGLKEVLKLRPVSYLWKKRPEDGLALGLIAQEIRKVIPEVVTEGTDEEKTLAVKYSELIPVLIKAIQEQQRIIDVARDENSSLKAKLDKLAVENASFKADLEVVKKLVGMETRKN